MTGYWGRHVDQATGEIKEAHSELRILRWETAPGGLFHYEVIGMKEDDLNRADIRHLHFDGDDSGATWLSYLSDAGSGLQRCQSLRRAR